MAFSSLAKIAFGSLAMAEAMTLNFEGVPEGKHASAELGNNPEFPRMLLMRGCDGSKRITSTAQALLSNHGLPVVVGSDMLSPDRNQFLEKSGNNLKQAIELANEDARNQEKTLMFKATTGGHFGTVWPRVKTNLKAMGTLSVIGSRKNMLDEVICRARNCLDDAYGYPVNNEGKNFSGEVCFDKTHTGKREFQVHLDAKKLIQSIDKENKFAEDTQRQLHMSGFPYAEVQVEKLLGYTLTNTQEDLDVAVREWSIFLRGWGVHPDEKTIETRLKKDQGLERPSNHKDQIHNFKEIHDLLRAATPEYKHLLLDCGAPSDCHAGEDVAEDDDAAVYETSMMDVSASPRRRDTR